MNKHDYDRIIIDFHTKAFIDMSLKEGVRFAEENVENFLSKFMNTFNSGLAENFLSGLNDTYPQLKDKVAQYPEHYWQSQQASDLLRSKLDQAMSNHFSLEGVDTSSETRRNTRKSWEYGKDTELTMIDYIDSLVQVGRRDMVYKAIDYVSQSVKSYQEQIGYAPKDLQEHMKKNIFKLEQDIESAMSDRSSSASTRHLDKSPEVKMILSELQKNLGWDIENKEKQAYLDGQQAALHVLNPQKNRI